MKKLILILMVLAAVFSISCTQNEITNSQLNSAKEAVLNMTFEISDVNNGVDTTATFYDGYATVASISGTPKTVGQIKSEIADEVEDAIDNYGSNLDDVFDNMGTSNIVAYHATGTTANSASTASYTSWTSGSITQDTTTYNYYKFVITLVADEDYKFADGQDKTVTLYLTINPSSVS